MDVSLIPLDFTLHESVDEVVVFFVPPLLYPPAQYEGIVLFGAHEILYLLLP